MESNATPQLAPLAPIPTPRLYRAAANFFSFIFSPLLAPTYAIAAAWATTVLLLLPQATMRTLLLMVFCFTCLFPLVAIGVMYKLKLVSDPGLNNRRERTLPFAVAAAGYAACLIFFIHINAPSWLVMFMGAALAALAICVIINLKWKISVHLTALGGLVAFILRLIADGLTLFHAPAILTAAILAAGLTASSRLILYRHTPSQVAAGFLNGFLCVYILTAISW
ncbi:MAG: hypothetical protein NC342_08120 [Pseudoflavonifractor sp.]|nr:hypothetical protein [Alloprevotella sp.]MCM1117486.1 hypothetical protein [Pseudoflavonifractor sp.]